MSERASMDMLRMRGATALFMMLLSVCWGVIGGEDAYVVGVTLERMAAGQALAQQNTQRPPVDRLGVRTAQQHLRLGMTRARGHHRHVLLRSAVAVAAQLADGPLQLAAQTVVARQAEVRELDVAVGAQQHVLRLQVPLW